MWSLGHVPRGAGPQGLGLTLRRRAARYGGGITRRSEFRVLVTGLPKTASWQDLKDHMRKAGDVTFAQARPAGSVLARQARAGAGRVSRRQPGAPAAAQPPGPACGAGAPSGARCVRRAARAYEITQAYPDPNPNLRRCSRTATA